jgi:small subunit ribosomal protein S21
MFAFERRNLCRKGVKRKMAYINVNANEPIENALRRFKRKVISEEIIKDYRKHAHFVPPGQKAKLKSQNARKRNRRRFKQMRMSRQYGNNSGGGYNGGNSGGGYNNSGGGGYNNNRNSGGNR